MTPNAPTMQAIHHTEPTIEPNQVYEAVRAFVGFRLNASRCPPTPRGFFEALAHEPEPAFDPIVELPGMGPFRVIRLEEVEGSQGPRVICELVDYPHVWFQTHAGMIERQCERVADLFMQRVVDRVVRVRVAG